MEVIKERGLPVGLRYRFATPPVSLAYGTTGISNLSFANDFRVLAYPDFVLTNRFAISSPDRPFIFSVWILGGAGWINIDSSYRPLENQLHVSVSVSVGASAFVGFGFAGVSGSVYFVYAATIKYQKLLGQRGGGLSIGLVVVVAGNVDVLGIAHAYIGIVLRLTYHENGDIDAKGRMSIKIRITRWFKIKVRTSVTYKMRGGKSRTSSRTDVETQRLLRSRRAA